MSGAPRAALYAPPKRIPPHILACSFAAAIDQSFSEASAFMRVTLAMPERELPRCRAELCAPSLLETEHAGAMSSASSTGLMSCARLVHAIVDITASQDACAWVVSACVHTAQMLTMQP